MSENLELLTCSRRFEWDALHRVPGHRGACRAFHGHRYAAEIECDGTLPSDGMVIDFSVLKSLVGSWINDHWDHTALFWSEDEDLAIDAIKQANSSVGKPIYLLEGPPTAEHIALELAKVAQMLLESHSIFVRSVRVFETPQCSATCTLRVP
jgi:6-pyruvoyltetrahydropterin/6-carboxytetrahydropterin synthase